MFLNLFMFAMILLIFYSASRFIIALFEGKKHELRLSLVCFILALLNVFRYWEIL